MKVPSRRSRKVVRSTMAAAMDNIYGTKLLSMVLCLYLTVFDLHLGQEASGQISTKITEKT